MVCRRNTPARERNVLEANSGRLAPTAKVLLNARVYDCSVLLPVFASKPGRKTPQTTPSTPKSIPG
jgi:hypothetical protein